MDSAASSHRRPPRHHEPSRRPESLHESTCNLLNQAKDGDSQALDELCTRYLPRLHQWATGRIPYYARSLVDTNDLVQETLVRTVRQLDGFLPRHPGAFPAYLRKTILNRIREEIRRTTNKPAVRSLTGDEQDPSPSPLEQAIGRDLAERYEEALLHLKEEDRAAIFLRIEMGMNFNEIADALNKPSTNAAWMAVSRALVRLAEEMSDEKRQGQH